jgi:hypothetical protein
MAEKISTTFASESFINDEHRDHIETRFAHLIEFVAHTVERPAGKEFADDTMDAFKSALSDLLKSLHISQVDAVVDHLELRLKKGQHDLVMEFLRNVSKLQHADFAQEFLSLQSVPVMVAADVPLTDASRLGHTAVRSFDE